MRYGKVVIYLFTILFAAVAVFFGIKEPREAVGLPLTVGIVTEQGEEKLESWEDENGNHWFFLPSHAGASQVVLYKDTFLGVELEGQRVKDGMVWETLQTDTPYTVTCADTQYTLTVLQSKNVPAMYIDVPSGTMAYIHAEKGNEETGAMRLYTPDGTLVYGGNLESINGRGNGTWRPDKKPYSLKLSAEADLLGMGSAQRWILLANAFDSTNLRNKMIYDFSRDAGLAYTPECELVDLYLNGEYAGVYLLSERNEVAQGRVALAREGSFLVSKEWDYRLEEQQLPFVQTASGAALRIHYSTVASDTMTELWQSVEDAVAAPDGIDPATGKHWTQLIDLDSWARKYLVEEIFGNPDASIISQFFYLDGGDESGKIYAGPVWDQDLAMGNTMMWPEFTANMLFANRDNISATPWFHDLYQQEEFYQYVRQLWQQDFKPLLEQLVTGGMADYASNAAEASRMNAVRWAMGDIREENHYIQQYMSQRLEFLDYLWTQEPEYCLVQVNSGRGLFACYVLEPGNVLPELPSYDDDSLIFYGWHREDTGEPFDVTQPIYEDLWIYLKQESAEAAQ